jgi:hypothetical protein
MIKQLWEGHEHAVDKLIARRRRRLVALNARHDIAAQVSTLTLSPSGTEDIERQIEYAIHYAAAWHLSLPLADSFIITTEQHGNSGDATLAGSLSQDLGQLLDDVAGNKDWALFELRPDGTPVEIGAQDARARTADRRSSSPSQLRIFA